MPATVAALQRGETIRVARLVHLDFAAAPAFLHQGVGPLRTADGQVWDGIGRLGQISEIDRAVVAGGGAPTLTLSGVDTGLIAATLAASEQVKGRWARILDQHYDADWNLIDLPVAVYVGVMDRMTLADDGATATVTVSLVTPLYRRRRAAFAYLNQASQTRRSPSDRGLGQIPALLSKTLTWPNY